MPLLCFAAAAYSGYTVLAIGIGRARQTQYNWIVAGAAALVNIALNLALIPPYGMMGAAVATLVAYVVLFFHLPNTPFAVDDPKGFNLPLDDHPRPLAPLLPEPDADRRRQERQVRRLGRLRRHVMGHYDGSKMAMWQIAQQYTLADNFFMGGFGGSFLNHQWLICACAPVLSRADTSPAKPTIAVVEPDGVTLTVAANSPKSAMDGIPKFVSDGNLTPDFYAVNTMQPPYQPSGNMPAQGGDPRYADPAEADDAAAADPAHDRRPAERQGLTWAWYSGAWQDALDHGNATPVPNFQYHHQPFNYYRRAIAPGTRGARRAHAGRRAWAASTFIKAIDDGQAAAGRLLQAAGQSQPAFGLCQHPAGDAHIADVVAHLEKSPQWAHMLVIVTYDENGGIWDHVAPPKGDRWGPGTRIPAIIVSPYAKQGFVDHTPNDTTSILRFITERFDLDELPGIKSRDEGDAKHGNPPLGDLTEALEVSQN